jgi:hypothetical protein
MHSLGRPGVKEREVCKALVWDGPYKMQCGYVLVNEQCIRHDVPFGRFASQRQTEAPVSKSQDQPAAE